jgi:hypothetical protein
MPWRRIASRRDANVCLTAERKNTIMSTKRPRKSAKQKSAKQKTNEAKKRRAANARSDRPGTGDTMITRQTAAVVRAQLVERLTPTILKAWARSDEAGFDDPAILVVDPADSLGAQLVPGGEDGARVDVTAPYVGTVSRRDIVEILRKTNERGDQIAEAERHASRKGLFLVCIAYEGVAAGEVVMVDGNLVWGRPDSPGDSDQQALN